MDQPPDPSDDFFLMFPCIGVAAALALFLPREDWHNVWISNGALTSSPVWLLLIRRVKWIRTSIAFEWQVICGCVASTLAVFLFALVDFSHPRSPPGAYIHAGYMFAAVAAAFIALWLARVSLLALNGWMGRRGTG